MLKRRSVLLALAFTACIGGNSPIHAQLPAGKPIRIIYAFAAGDGGDAIARLLAEHLPGKTGAPAIVENRAGASGRIGTRAVIAAEPDGTTLLLSPMGPMSIHPLTYSNLDFDPFKDLAPVSQVATFDIALAVAPTHPSRNLPELVVWLKANPEKANYGTPGLGGLPHFFAIMFASSAEVTLRNVPYRGAGAVLADLVASQLRSRSAPPAISSSCIAADTPASWRPRPRSDHRCCPTCQPSWSRD